MKELYNKWISSNLPSDLQNELKTISADEQAIEDRFYQYVSFGTGGMRGILGAGTNRINIFTIRRVAEGLARYIESHGEEAKKRGVVVAYDTRHFSQQFAVETAGVFGAHGIKAFIYKEPRPTPQLSFTVRELKAFAGVVITASHNPKQYNGFKVYGEDGAQLVPAGAKQIVDHMEKIEDLFNISALEIYELESQGLVQWILEDFDEKYQEKLFTLKENGMIDRMMNIVYTPLHGAGVVPVMEGLKRFGFHNVHLVKEQGVQDGAFPTLSFPNPEEPEALQYAMELGEKVSADLLLATDPDADRLGVAVRIGDRYEQLTGNQLGALLLHYIIQTHLLNGTLPIDGVLIKTIVTAELGAKIAAHYNIETVNTLTGFKYIAEKIEEYEKSGERTFLFGYEESYGYLIKSFARDKDAVQMALKVSEMAAYYRAKGKTLLDALEELYKEFGYHKETLISRVFEGKKGREQMNASIDHIRGNIPAEIAGIGVSRVEDYLASVAILADGHQEEIFLPKENMIKIVLENEAWVAIRPSGTEPKCKYYVGVVGGSEAEAGQILENIVAGISFN
ncbi:phospho-sugar mutase [Ureibacillus sinduriensis]|uniref:Phosphoglucomutase n=1 Tax=Ureibacillus sinduriensis BLB-1 = JCM 15800 TaxID=1384057 RepID=A0A0A3IGP0_9BACL|nr:phospho-sugar mutase [Ureibacillus sinduriensis]KGR74002.1 phosphoglucomutase [Ureibacillus sinduriensis BLB-1 = JCM 15800]